MPQESLKNKVVLLTGASKGLGKMLAQQLAQEGAKLMLCSRRLDVLETIKTEINQSYSLADDIIACSQCDVTNPSLVLNTVKDTIDVFGRIDILINNAAIATKFQLFQEHTVAEISDVIDTNLKGPMYFIQAVLPHMVNQGVGDILNINSVAGKRNYAYCSVYGATKFGLDSLTQIVAEEQRPNNIRVMGVYPGRIDTPIWDSLEPGVAQDPTQMLKTQDAAEAILFALKQPRHVEIRELMILPSHCD